MARVLMLRIPFSSVIHTIAFTTTFLLASVGTPPLVSFALDQVTTAITHTTGAGNLGTRMTTDGHTIQITGGTRSDYGTGTNLFHSFDQFSVGSLDTAKFVNTTPSIQTFNILGRVTGHNPSSIFGTIDTTSYPGANFFLMNPAGIVFGPNATLHASGSVAFTTADYLRLAKTDGSQAGIFHAHSTADNILTSAPVVAFGFLSQEPADITLQGSTLEVPVGKSLSLVGGNITIESSMLGNRDVPLPSDPGKQVLIASVASRGEILEGTLAPAANINGQSPTSLGPVQITEGSIIDTTGESGGTILIRSGRLVVDNSIIGSNTGNIVLNANSIQVKNSAQIITFTTTTADAGSITLETLRDIKVGSNSRIASFSDGGTGHAGNITLISRQGDINFTNGGSVTSQSSPGSGSTGNIKLAAPRGDIRLDNSFIFTSARKNTGSTGSIHGGIQITTNNLRLINASAIDSDNFSAQRSHHTEILLTGGLTLFGNSEIQTTTTGGAPSANLIVKAREILMTTGSNLSANTTNSGTGGNVSIRSLTGPSTVITIDGPESGIFTGTEGSGRGGTIDLSVQSLILRNGGTLSAVTSGPVRTATGGSIIVQATDHVTMTNGASITASSVGPADAGNIKIIAGRQLTIQDSGITTEAKTARGGNIDIQAIDTVRIANGRISTSVGNGDGSGGNITIDPNMVVLQNSQIVAKAIGGNGGNITITTPLFLVDQLSLVDASSQFGLNGTVTIQSPTSNLSGTVGQLTSKPSPVHLLIQNRCAALADGQPSTLIVSGRQTFSTTPGGWVSSPFMVASSHEPADRPVTSVTTETLGLDDSSVPPVSLGSTAILSLRRLTPPGFLVRSFVNDAQTGCRL